MSEDAADLQSMLPLWEYTFQTSDKQRKQAVRSFSELRRGRFVNWTMIAIAWLILIAAIAVIIWFCAAAIAGLQYVAQGVVSDEVVAVLVPFAGGTLYILVVRSIGGYFRKKAKNKESGKVTVSIKVFDGRFVEFLDEGLVKVRKIERVCFSKDYLFFLIDGGARFIYLPRGLIADDAFKKIGIWAAEIHL